MSGNTSNNSVSERSVDAHRHAYNAAFHELGLGWYWDSEHYKDVLCMDGEKNQICAYLKAHQPHLLRAYDAEFLAAMIQAAQVRFYDAHCVALGNRAPAANWAELHQRQIGV